MRNRRRLILVALVLGSPVLGLIGCASQGYGSGGGFDEEYYDDCYDGYCVGYDAYGRAYHRAPETVARGAVDPVDRSPGSTRTVSRDTTTRASASTATASTAARMSVSVPRSAPPAPTTVSRHN